MRGRKLKVGQLWCAKDGTQCFVRIISIQNGHYIFDWWATEPDFPYSNRGPKRYTFLLPPNDNWLWKHYKLASVFDHL